LKIVVFINGSSKGIIIISLESVDTQRAGREAQTYLAMEINVTKYFNTLQITGVLNSAKRHADNNENGAYRLSLPHQFLYQIPLVTCPLSLPEQMPGTGQSVACLSPIIRASLCLSFM